MKVRDLIKLLEAYPDQDARVVSISPSEVDGSPVVSEIEAIKPRELFARGQDNYLDAIGAEDDEKVIAAELS